MAKKIKNNNIPRDLLAAVLSEARFRPRVADTSKKRKCSKTKRRAWKTKGEY
jgi:hypothetical protein